MKIANLDIVFISYDEPNADLNWADLKHKAPWSQRVHGIKGSDNAHKAAAELSQTDWFVTVDGDNIVYYDFFDLDLKDMPGIEVYSWCGKNSINNLRYGNGGLKIWHKDFVLNMKTHEASESAQAQVDFCWEAGYQNFPEVYSETVINHTPYQAWRAGFREGVKMLLNKGVKCEKKDLLKEVYWHNIHRFKIWASLGSHVKNGLYAIHGARMGAYMTYCTDWDYIQVRDFDALKSIFDTVNENNLTKDISRYGEEIKQQLGIHLTEFDKDQSQYMIDIYEDAISLGQTYYNKDPVWRNIS